ncbi:MAG TPA: type II secretion system protein [Gallionella sp.]|nr:type II secretion system protein [Gallionella sp.]
MVLVAVIAMGIFAEVATFYASRSRQMDREAELLFRGTAYRNAIKSYYESGRPIKTYPRSLDDLVKDPRVAHKSHLRMLYPDPFGKKDEGWKLLRASDGGISGVSSKSTEKPIKTGNFQQGYEKFESASSYSDWAFEFVPMSGVIPVSPR